MIENIRINNTVTDLIVSASDEVIAVLNMLFCNTTTSTRVLTVYCHSNVSSSNDNTTIVKELEIPAGDTYVWDVKLILYNSQKVTAITDVADSVTATINSYTL